MLKNLFVWQFHLVAFYFLQTICCSYVGMDLLCGSWLKGIRYENSMNSLTEALFNKVIIIFFIVLKKSPFELRWMTWKIKFFNNFNKRVSWKCWLTKIRLSCIVMVKIFDEKKKMITNKVARSCATPIICCFCESSACARMLCVRGRT